ncbi:E3 ubiquitin-protein ligase RNF25 [Linum perenne]
MAQEEILLEVEAVQAVYGDDCVVLKSFPPHLQLHFKPRTAEISSQQFVEALISIRADVQYPEELPSVTIIESKGLDELRQKVLLNSMRNKALELSSCSMLVALCEVSHVQSNENVTPYKNSTRSCGAALHHESPGCECMIRWWTWLEKQKENTGASSTTGLERMRVENKMETEDNMGQCPVCRKVFDAKDLKHVLDLVGTHSSHLSLTKNDDKDDEEETVVGCESEHIRREKFEAILKLQEEKHGLIEPKKSIAVLPGMFLPQPAPAPAPTPAVSTETNSGESSERPNGVVKRRSSNRRNRNQHKSQMQVKQWARKESGTSN